MRSRSPASCTSRSVSSLAARSASRSSSSLSACWSAKSSSARSRASGVRSSWPASATNPRSRSSAASSRASIALSVSPRRWSSSPVGGTGSRSPRRSAETSAAPLGAAGATHPRWRRPRGRRRRRCRPSRAPTSPAPPRARSPRPASRRWSRAMCYCFCSGAKGRSVDGLPTHSASCSLSAGQGLRSHVPSWASL